MKKQMGGDRSQEEAAAAEVKRAIAWQIDQAMKARRISKSEMAQRMHTSRIVVDRLLDENNTSITLATLARVSVVLGVPLRFELGSGACGAYRDSFCAVHALNLADAAAG